MLEFVGRGVKFRISGYLIPDITLESKMCSSFTPGHKDFVCKKAPGASGQLGDASHQFSR